MVDLRASLRTQQNVKLATCFCPICEFGEKESHADRHINVHSSFEMLQSLVLMHVSPWKLAEGSKIVLEKIPTLRFSSVYRRA